MNEIEPVKLNREEQAHFDAICWDLDDLGKKDHDTRYANAAQRRTGWL